MPSPAIDPKILAAAQSFFPGEKIDFAVQSKRKLPLIYGIGRLVTSLIMVTVILTFSASIIGNIFTPPSGEDATSKYILGGFFGLFFILSMVSLIDSLRILFWDPVIFVGTDKRVAMIGKKEVYSKKWNVFFDNVLKFGKNDKGSVMLMPKPGISGESAFVMSSIPNCDAVQEYCKQRISELNDTGKSTAEEKDTESPYEK